MISPEKENPKEGLESEDVENKVSSVWDAEFEVAMGVQTEDVQ